MTVSFPSSSNRDFFFPSSLPPAAVCLPSSMSQGPSGCCPSCSGLMPFIGKTDMAVVSGLPTAYVHSPLPTVEGGFLCSPILPHIFCGCLVEGHGEEVLRGAALCVQLPGAVCSHTSPHAPSVILLSFLLEASCWLTWWLCLPLLLCYRWDSAHVLSVFRGACLSLDFMLIGLPCDVSFCWAQEKLRVGRFFWLSLFVKAGVTVFSAFYLLGGSQKSKYIFRGFIFTLNHLEFSSTNIFLLYG